MSGHVRWADIRAEQVTRAGGEEAVQAGKQELLAVAVGHWLAAARAPSTRNTGSRLAVGWPVSNRASQARETPAWATRASCDSRVAGPDVG